MCFKRFVLMAVLVTLGLPASAYAAFPGQNGKIAFTSAGQIAVVNPDGSGLATLTSGPGANWNPAFSSDGQRIAFQSSRDGNHEIYVMNSDGTGQQRITTNAAGDSSPTWSPYGTRIAFARDGDIWSMRSDGTDQVNLTNTPALDSNPAWSPGGTLIAYDDGFDTVQLMAPDGTSVDYIDYGLGPTWSPDGREVWAGYDWLDDVEEVTYEYLWWQTLGGPAGGNYFAPYGHVDQPAVSPDNTQFVYAAQPGYGTSLGIMTRAGANRTLPVDGRDPDWQPIPVDTPSAFARPKGATPVYLSLVPAHFKCTSPNTSHGAPLAYGSCRGPGIPADLTLGTPDANGKPASSIGFLQLYVHVGTPGGPDDSDVLIAFSLKSVFKSPDLTDYTGALEVRTNLQITDKQAGVAATGVDFPLSFAAPCAGTADPDTGGSCAIQTSADAIRPGLAPEGQRSLWELEKAQVYDSGFDGNVATTRDNHLFETQGVFVP